MEKFTEQQTLQAVQEYKLGKSPKDIAAELNRSERSVIAKLSREGVYQAQPKQAPTLRKADLVAQIAAQCGQACESFDSFEKCSKPQLELLLDWLRWRNQQQ